MMTCLMLVRIYILSGENCSQVKKMNIMEVLPGIKYYAKDKKHETGSFFKIIDMFDEIVELSNKYKSLEKGA